MCPPHVRRGGQRERRVAVANRRFCNALSKKHVRLLLCNWNVLTLIGKDLELVEEAKKYHLDIVRVSSSKKRGSEIVALGKRLFYSVADPSMCAQAGVEIFTSPRLSDCVFD